MLGLLLNVREITELFHMCVRSPLGGGIMSGGEAFLLDDP